MCIARNGTLTTTQVNRNVCATTMKFISERESSSAIKVISDMLPGAQPIKQLIKLTFVMRKVNHEAINDAMTIEPVAYKTPKTW